MKKYLKYIPHLIFFLSMIIIGASGKLLGAKQPVELFEMLKLFGQPEHIGRYLVGGAELLAGIGILFAGTRKLAALLGIILMLGALYFHATIIGFATSAPAIITLLVAIWIFVKTKKFHNHNKCEAGVCTPKS